MSVGRFGEEKQGSAAPGDLGNGGKRRGCVDARIGERGCGHRVSRRRGRVSQCTEQRERSWEEEQEATDQGSRRRRSQTRARDVRLKSVWAAQAWLGAC
jgi:hypothetical protein